MRLVRHLSEFCSAVPTSGKIHRSVFQQIADTCEFCTIHRHRSQYSLYGKLTECDFDKGYESKLLFVYYILIIQYAIYKLKYLCN